MTDINIELKKAIQNINNTNPYFRYYFETGEGEITHIDIPVKEAMQKLKNGQPLFISFKEHKALNHEIPKIFYKK